MGVLLDERLIGSCLVRSGGGLLPMLHLVSSAVTAKLWHGEGLQEFLMSFVAALPALDGDSARALRRQRGTGAWDTREGRPVNFRERCSNARFASARVLRLLLTSTTTSCSSSTFPSLFSFNLSLQLVFCKILESAWMAVLIFRVRQPLQPCGPVNDPSPTVFQQTIGQQQGVGHPSSIEQ